MRILIVYHSVIPAIKYGGTERVIWYLGKALVSMGHEVTYLVNEGSYCDFAKVIYIDNTRSFHESIPTDIDVIHFNETPPEPEKIKKPYVVTIHGNIPISSISLILIPYLSRKIMRPDMDLLLMSTMDWTGMTMTNQISILKKSIFIFLARLPGA